MWFVLYGGMELDCRGVNYTGDGSEVTLILNYLPSHRLSKYSHVIGNGARAKVSKRICLRTVTSPIDKGLGGKKSWLL